MGKIKSIMLWLMAVIMCVSCAATRKAEQGVSEQRRDSVASIVMDSVVKSKARVDSSVVIVTDEHHASVTMTENGSNEETITERVTESTDAIGNKTVTTDRTIHRKGDYERNATYDAQLKHQEEAILRMQHLIDSMAFSNQMSTNIHWDKKDSTNVTKETNTKDIKPALISNPISIFIFWIVIIGIAAWLYHKR